MHWKCLSHFLCEWGRLPLPLTYITSTFTCWEVLGHSADWKDPKGICCNSACSALYSRRCPMPPSIYGSPHSVDPVITILAYPPHWYGPYPHIPCSHCDSRTGECGPGCQWHDLLSLAASIGVSPASPTTHHLCYLGWFVSAGISLIIIPFPYFFYPLIPVSFSPLSGGMGWRSYRSPMLPMLPPD